MVKATKRKRRKDKDDDVLAAQIAEVAEVSKYIREASGERIREKGELYLRQGAMIAGMTIPTPVPEEESKISNTPLLNTDASQTKSVVSEGDEEKISNTSLLIPEQGKTDTPAEQEKISYTPLLIPEEVRDGEPKISHASLLNNFRLSYTPLLIPTQKDTGLSHTSLLNKTSYTGLLNLPFFLPGISYTSLLNGKKISYTSLLNGFWISYTSLLNLYPVKVQYKHDVLAKFIYGISNILFHPNLEGKMKTVLVALLCLSVGDGFSPVKFKSNDLLKDLGISKRAQKTLPDAINATGLAEVNVRKKAGTVIAFNPKIFEPNGEKGSILIDRLINIYNLSIYQENIEEKNEEKKSIPLQEIGKYVSVLSLHLAGFPLKSVTGSLIEAIKGKDPELVTAFWIYAKNNSDKIKSPGAYLIKVLDNNDTGNLSGEVMEKARACVKAAQVIVKESYDEPELSFLREMALKLSPEALDKNRPAITSKLKASGRKLLAECESILSKLPKK